MSRHSEQEGLGDTLAQIWQNPRTRRSALAGGLVVAGATLVGVPVLIKSLLTPKVELPAPLYPTKEVFAFIRGNLIEEFVDIESVDFDMVSNLVYFGVPVDKDGNLLTDNLAYQALEKIKTQQLLEKARQHQTKIDLTLVLHNNQAIRDLLADPAAQARLIEQTLSEVKFHNFSGVNFDFEYDGDPGQLTRQRFSRLVERFGSQLHSEVAGSQLSVAIAALSGKDSTLFDGPSLARGADRLLLMTYEYGTPGSDLVRPSAPLYSSSQYDVFNSFQNLGEQVPSSQIVLGVPLYGLSFTTREPRMGAATIGKNEYLTYAQAQKILRENPTAVQGWDDQGKVEWMARFLGRGLWQMIVVGGPRAIRERCLFVKEQGMAGVMYWALDQQTYYEPDREFWDILWEEFAGKAAEIKKVEPVTYLQPADLGPETVIAMVLSTFSKPTTPTEIARIFENKGFYDSSQNVYIRSGTEFDVLTWLAREHGLVVSKLLDRFHPYASQEDKKSTFDYQEGKRLINGGNLIISSGRLADKVEAVYLIKDVDPLQRTLTIIDQDGQEKIVTEAETTPFIYAYTVRAKS